MLDDHRFATGDVEVLDALRDRQNPAWCRARRRGSTSVSAGAACENGEQYSYEGSMHPHEKLIVTVTDTVWVACTGIGTRHSALNGIPVSSSDRLNHRGRE